MRLEQLSGLAEIAKCCSISMAAKNIHISRQALDNSMRTLERELGCQLLERSERGVRLTENGKKAVIAARDILARLDALYADLANTASPRERIRGELSISISPMLGVSVLPFAFTEFRSLYPNVAVFTCEKYRQDIIGQIAENITTCGILLVSKLLVEFFDGIPDDIELFELTTFRTYAAVSPQHPLANRKTLTVGALSQYPIIVYEVGGASGVHSLSKLADFDVSLSTNNPVLCKDELNKGRAVMYSFQPYVQYNVFPDFVHIPLSDKRATLTAFVAINKNMPRQTREIVSAFVNVFTRYL